MDVDEWSKAAEVAKMVEQFAEEVKKRSESA
jgi:hypothetical protein